MSTTCRAVPALTWTSANATRSISRSGRPPSQASRIGHRRGARGARAGISNARPCRRSTSACRLTFMAVAPISSFLITKTRRRRPRPHMTRTSSVTGCIRACCASTPRRCQRAWATSCCSRTFSKLAIPAPCACSCCRRTIARRSISPMRVSPRPTRRMVICARPCATCAGPRNTPPRTPRAIPPSLTRRARRCAPVLSRPWTMISTRRGDWPQSSRLPTNAIAFSNRMTA